MKYPLVAGVLGFEKVELHSNFFGGKPFAKLDEDQLEKLEAAVKQNDVSALEKTIADQKDSIEALQAKASDSENALQQALEMNGIKLEEGQEHAAAIALLGQKCKEYGESKNRHSFAGHDGKNKDVEPNKDGLIDGYFDPKDPHNQID
ncbi:hypothetical protein HZP84_03955 [Elizabethkingia anophelis]|nr:hypothetical protein [Elizabethkingia anophelis]